MCFGRNFCAFFIATQFLFYGNISVILTVFFDVSILNDF
jgi:hypothetical protein